MGKVSELARNRPAPKDAAIDGVTQWFATQYKGIAAHVDHDHDAKIEAGLSEAEARLTAEQDKRLSKIEARQEELAEEYGKKHAPEPQVIEKTVNKTEVVREQVVEVAAEIGPGKVHRDKRGIAQSLTVNGKKLTLDRDKNGRISGWTAHD